MKTCQKLKCATIALLCGGYVLAGQGDPVAAAPEDQDNVSQADSAGVVIDNLPTHEALPSESFILPATWGGNGTWQLSVSGTNPSTSEGPATAVSGSTYTWSSNPYAEGTYTVSLSPISGGSAVYTANFKVETLASVDWSSLTVDNQTKHVAKSSESLALPAGWGESGVTDLQLTVTDDMGTRTIDLSGSAASYNWNTQPYMPGDFYTAQLTWKDGDGNSHSSPAASYTVEGTDMTAAEETVALDNQMDEKSSASVEANDVRDMAQGHTNLFQLVSLGTAEAPTLTFEGTTIQATADENGQWLWATNGFGSGIYTFTKTVDGVTETAKFRLTSQDVAVLFGDKALPVDKDWFVTNVNGGNQPSGTAQEISNQLKAEAANGTAFWKNYVLGWNPTDTEKCLLVEITGVNPSTGMMNAKVIGRLTDTEKYGIMVPRYRLFSADSANGTFAPVADVEGQTSPEFNNVPFTLPQSGQRYYRAVIVVEPEQ